ncbi:potassium uptake protein TrkH [Luminiphilus syltensis NOR5-1B]|uniref:Trk system potassium uptake protein n=1 Tax=Luminiphilus syltensis NOR5-1B TaxID=565045 RepID=B8KUF7_9GAMM|nr:TrkH family potassium uptake protein [Luminiphilus syltensis]EED35762.1 potassium uptake protein TrkH [Luminiphilus syltensis NOR5-1B]
MHISVSLRIMGVLLVMFSTAMLPSLVLGLVERDGSANAFAAAFAINIFAGAALWLPTRRSRSDLRIRDGFLVTALFWIVLGVFGSLPFILSDAIHMSAIDAIFESISGLTTTGATVIVGLDDLPRSILLYRQLLQWLGGIGIIVLAVAILPMLGIGGMQLFRAESSGHAKERKLTPRVTGTAKALFSIYVGLTSLCAAAYYAAGMSGFDAICHAFSTVAIGGFSTHDASMGFFDNDKILLICTFFMVISAINFGLHFIAFQRRSLNVYNHDSETKFFSAVVVIAIVVTCSTLIVTDTLDVKEGLVHGLFQTVSIATTTGFATRDFSVWPIFLPVFLLMLSFMGGCAGSTGGGMKAMRLLLIFRQGMRELRQLLHPNAVIPLKLDARRVQPSTVSAVWSFFAVYMFCFVTFMLLMLATGLDFTSAFSAVAASMNNLGPGLGLVAPNYSAVSEIGKCLLCVAMLLGRLEVFTLLVLFTPAFWRP